LNKIVFAGRAPNEVSMRKFKLTCLATIAVVLATMPQFVKAGPCTSDIAEWETTSQQPGIEALATPGQASIDTERSRPLTPGSTRQADEHSWPQLSATIARAKRLDMYGDRLGCTSALNAARAMSVLVARE
jgi:hypothetical protein